MAISQTQIRDHNIATVAAAALVGRPDEVAYVAALNAHFVYSIDAAAVVDGTTILTALGTNAVWKIVGGAPSIQNNFAAVAAPTATADSAAGYAVGSLWVDVTNNIAYICVDSTVTTAIWNELDPTPQNQYIGTIAPTVNNDSLQGYSVGSHWYDTVLTDLYIASSVVPGSAVWVKVSNDKRGYTSAVDPTAFDSGPVYDIGSIWVNITTPEAFLCVDNTNGAGVWISLSNISSPTSAYDNISTATTIAAGSAITVPTVPLGATAAAFNAGSVRVLFNGIEMVKNSDVTWASATTFNSTYSFESGDVFTVKP